MDIQLFIENLDNLSHADFQWFSGEALSSEASSERSACLALCAIGSSDSEEAIRWMDDAIGMHSSSDFISFADAVVHMRTGTVASAIEPLRCVSNGFAKHHEARVLLATALLFAGRFDEADAIAVEAKELDDDMRATLLGLRARCASERGDELMANALYGEALTYAPRLEWVRQARDRTDLGTEAPAGQPEVVVI